MYQKKSPRLCETTGAKVWILRIRLINVKIISYYNYIFFGLKTVFITNIFNLYFDTDMMRYNNHH